MGEVAEYGRDLISGDPDPGRVNTLFFPPAVSLTALSLAVVLAVFKPWGRLRRRKPVAIPDARARRVRVLTGHARF